PVRKIPPRGLEKQRKSLVTAYKLLENGWGLNLGDPEPQKAELAGNLEFVEVKVRFYPPVSEFILEGERRHIRQKITTGCIENGEYSYIEYAVDLPGRSLNEFSRWVYRYMDKAQVLSPPKLVAEHYKYAQVLLDRYRNLV
ncbi:MAG: WYL domain-containing protein, partial [Dolichospermum sp.]